MLCGGKTSPASNQADTMELLPADTTDLHHHPHTATNHAKLQPLVVFKRRVLGRKTIFKAHHFDFGHNLISQRRICGCWREICGSRTRWLLYLIICLLNFLKKLCSYEKVIKFGIVHGCI
ncbi:hypothetical protein AVEN_163263-1 [Araneus ventricosus]|uniref:Uncharacterized protein n=1 Tax=Araneus ventricosus TaxID=182803 RepID=A0A4Y2SDS6_ARAVE|nr:hypothetical protein AVEN_163263-1 [Araneus ventricosus]